MAESEHRPAPDRPARRDESEHWQPSDPPRPHGDDLDGDLDDVRGNDAAHERGVRPDQPPGPTGDMDQPGMDPEAEGIE